MAPVVLSPLCAAPPITSCVWPVQDWDCGKIAGATQLMLRTSPRYEVACPRPSGAFAHVAHRPAGRGPPCEGPCAWSASQVSPPRAGGGITLRGRASSPFFVKALDLFPPLRHKCSDRSSSPAKQTKSVALRSSDKSRPAVGARDPRHRQLRSRV